MESNYYAIIPANVRYDKNLSPNAKLLYGEITALANKTGCCFATNRYFSELYEVSQNSVSKWIKMLIDYGYIKSVLIYKEGTKEIDKRYLTIIVDPPQEKLYTPTQEKFEDNNTSNNNTIKIDFVSLLDFYNSTFNRRCSVFPMKAKKAFNERLKEGYKKKDIQNVFLNVSQDKWHIEKELKVATLEFLSRSNTFEMYASITPKLSVNQGGFTNH